MKSTLQGQGLTEQNESDAETPTRVIVGEPDALARRAISDRFEQDPDFSIIASSGDSREVMELSRHYRPELVVLDSDDAFNGLSTCRLLIASDPAVRILVLEGRPDGEREVAAFWAGACGVVPKDGGVDAILTACRQVLRGRTPHSDDAMCVLLRQMRSIPESGKGMRPVRSELTSREWEVLDLLTHGASTESIASDLYLSPDTVLSHVKNLMKKLDVTTRAEAVEKADRLRWPESTS